MRHLDPSVGPLFLGLIGDWESSRRMLLGFFIADLTVCVCVIAAVVLTMRVIYRHFIH